MYRSAFALSPLEIRLKGVHYLGCCSVLVARICLFQPAPTAAFSLGDSATAITAATYSGSIAVVL